MKRFFLGPNIKRLVELHPLKMPNGKELLHCTFDEEDGFQFSMFIDKADWPAAERELLEMGVENVEINLFTDL